MNTSNYLTLLCFLLVSWSCQNKKKETTDIAKGGSNNLMLDHFNIWVKDPQIAKERLSAIGFTAVPDSLSEIHHGQGTSGRYFNFLNAYLELIFVYDQKELEENNERNKDLDFTARANNDKNGASPFSIALKVKDYSVDLIPFEKVRYHQEWMEADASIYSAKNAKTHLKEPSIFVVYPGIESVSFESLAALDSLPSEDPSWKSFFKHPNGAKKLSNIIITSTEIDLNTETVKAVNDIENLSIKNGKEHLMEVYFDENEQGKSFDLRPELPLIIYL